MDGQIAPLREDCEHVVRTSREEGVSASLTNAIREFLAEGTGCTPQVIALSCALLMQKVGDLDKVFAQIQSDVMATLVYADDVVVRPLAG